MQYITFDKTKEFNIILLGRATIDLNPVDMNRPLDESTTFKKYLGGSPANTAVGLARLGKKCGFFGRVSDDQFGTYIINYFANEGIDVSHMVRCTEGESLGLTFTEILSPTQSSILMFREKPADLSLCVDDIDEEYLKKAACLLISGTSLSASPSREAAFKAMALAKKNNIPIIFDIDYRPYSWKNREEVAVYYSAAADEADIILGSREEYDMTDSLRAPGMDDVETAQSYFARNAKIVIIKHGKDGSTAYTNDGGKYSIKPFPVKSLKGFGGGDGYAAAFLSSLMDGEDIMDCLEKGSAEAAMLIASHACSADMPGKEALMEFIRKEKEEYGEMIARG